MNQILITVGIGIILNMAVHAEDTNTTFRVTPNDVVASVHLDGLHFRTSNQVVHNFADDRKLLINELLKTFNNPATPNYDRCTCALYLGEMRASEAAGALAASISLELDSGHLILGGIILAQYDPAFNAVVKIGCSAIPPLVRNLAESDDEKVRELSLKALCRIDGDKDISRLRLQKALKAETQPQEQAHLQRALAALDAASFPN